MPLCLTPEEIADLTGRKQAARQIQWLTENGWKFFVGGDGLPKVDREYYRQQFGVQERKKRVVRTEGLSRANASR